MKIGKQLDRDYPKLFRSESLHGDIVKKTGSGVKSQVERVMGTVDIQIDDLLFDTVYGHIVRETSMWERR